MNNLAVHTSRSTRAIGVLGALTIAIVMAGCAGTPSVEPQSSTPPSVAPSAPAAAPDDSATPNDPEGDAAMADAFAERDAFFAEQGFTGSTGPLHAQTDAQRALVKAQKDWTEKQGATWSDSTEPILLALASDTCETGILNQHHIDASTLKQLVVSSPLTAQLIPEDTPADKAALYERNIASMSVFGASYLCPADNDAWSAAFQTAYPS